jgi:hypothetical protein
MDFIMKNRIEELFYKADHSSDKWEPYFEIYERHLNRFAEKDIDFVEVGVYTGGSLDMWAQYFGKGSTITGIDIDPKCAQLQYNYPNVRVVLGNQVDPNFWDGYLKENKITAFLDDGGHHSNEQIITFEKVFPALELGGIYICEDTHTSYFKNYWGGGLDSKHSFITYAKGLVDVLHYDWKQETTSDLEIKKKITENISGVFFYDSVVVIEKFGKRAMNRVFAK